MSHVLEPVADEKRIHNVLQPCRKMLHVEITALRLNFHLARGSDLLESQESRSMVVDTDQTLGTFVGLRSKLLLKHQNTGSRVVLIPQSIHVHFAQ